jgi:hypothetical protein
MIYSSRPRRIRRSRIHHNRTHGGIHGSHGILCIRSRRAFRRGSRAFRRGSRILRGSRNRLRGSRNRRNRL